MAASLFIGSLESNVIPVGVLKILQHHSCCHSFSVLALGKVSVLLSDDEGKQLCHLCSDCILVPQFPCLLETSCSMETTALVCQPEIVTF